MKYKKNVYHVFLVLFQIQLIKSEIKYCHEAVASVKIVSFCPDSKEAWDIAAHRKNCSRMAAGQTCTTADKFQYHCVINGFRNKFVEVCAPTRIIFDPDCYALVSGGDFKSSTTISSTFGDSALVSGGDFKSSTTISSTFGDSDTEQKQNGTIIGIISAVLVVTILVIIGVLILKFKRRLPRLPSSKETQEEERSLMLPEFKNRQDLRHKQSKTTRRQRSSHSESSAYIGAYTKKTNLSGRQRSSLSESSAFPPNVHRSFENKRAPLLPFIGHRNKNEKNEDDRTERRVYECISKII
ncbi:uncharacterized protein LOC128182883 isoform X3 [Crassostrea angulata]|uniref:uncharacterized protein LOC128182883 isoform X3 n=1 Tax=Magallana angulata TaxID=2784310 RepID=UPI0022B12610|nr:uncharacterized protein LOC128182883 isoform X3 [Crassostrea angulata]